MAYIIAFANQKGGVGKTTTCVNLAACLSALGQQVLVCDLDPQGNTTSGSGIDKQSLDSTIADVLLHHITINEVIYRTEAGYGLVPANSDLTIAEVGLLSMAERERQLAYKLYNVRENYDYILLDCPPSLNMLTVNSLVAATSVLIPMQCEYYALEGLSGLLETIHLLRAQANPSLEIEGILRTLYDKRSNLTKEVSEQLFKHFSDKVYQTVIPRNVRLAEAPSYRQPALLYDHNSPGSIAYYTLAKEIIAKNKREKSIVITSVSQEPLISPMIIKAPMSLLNQRSMAHFNPSLPETN